MILVGPPRTGCNAIWLGVLWQVVEITWPLSRQQQGSATFKQREPLKRRLFVEARIATSGESTAARVTNTTKI
jgi:hypothetical protein